MCKAWRLCETNSPATQYYFQGCEPGHSPAGRRIRRRGSRGTEPDVQGWRAAHSRAPRHPLARPAYQHRRRHVADGVSTTGR
ncbi:hypothetical protein C4K27_4171 [Pseudomonas chlororaphis subsp. chlororaphis]|nr:hypothetical protein C4K27_4171 [Pseudomonas chlororaphis subsp. chlororaphis]